MPWTTFVRVNSSQARINCLHASPGSHKHWKSLMHTVFYRRSFGCSAGRVTGSIQLNTNFVITQGVLYWPTVRHWFQDWNPLHMQTRICWHLETYSALRTPH